MVNIWLDWDAKNDLFVIQKQSLERTIVAMMKGTLTVDSKQGVDRGLGDVCQSFWWWQCGLITRNMDNSYNPK